MACNWKSLVPEKYVPLTKCHCMIKQKSTDTDVEIVICTTEGLVLEFCSHRIVGSCKLKCMDSKCNKTKCIDPKCIIFFTTFNRKGDIFYIVDSDGGINILGRKKELQVIKQYHNVKKIVITDFSNTGFPQLGIWTKGLSSSKSPDIIEDFKEDGELSDTCSISSILTEKCQELEMKIKKYEHDLSLKKQHVMYFSAVTGHKKNFPSSSGFELVQLFGQDHVEIDKEEHLNKERCCHVAEIWQRIHNGKWVIGFLLYNTGQGSIKDLNSILVCDVAEKLHYAIELLMYSLDEGSPPCKRMKLDEEVTPGLTAWKKIDSLESERKAVLVAILEKPTFISNSTIKLSALITYKLENEDKLDQLPVSSIRLEVRDFTRGMYSPFKSETSDADLLSVMVSSEIVTLPVVYQAHYEPSLKAILVEELKFSEYSALGCLYHSGANNPELAGIMLHIDTVDTLNYKLSIWARDKQQICLLVHCMYSVLSAPLLMVLPPELNRAHVPEERGHRCLQEEVDLVLKQLKKWTVEELAGSKKQIIKLNSDLQVPYEDYHKFRIQLSELESKTDLAMEAGEYDAN